MAQLTEHSKKIKAEYAKEWNKKQLEEGKAKRMLLQLPKESADLFDSICGELNLSRPQALKTLCEHYLNTKK